MSAKNHDVNLETFPQHPHLERTNHLVLFTLFRKDNVKCQGKLYHGLCGSWGEQQNQTKRKEGNSFLVMCVPKVLVPFDFELRLLLK